MIPAEKRRADRLFWSFVRDVVVTAIIVVLIAVTIQAADYAIALMRRPGVVFAGDQK